MHICGLVFSPSRKGRLLQLTLASSLCQDQQTQLTKHACLLESRNQCDSSLRWVGCSATLLKDHILLNKFDFQQHIYF